MIRPASSDGYINHWNETKRKSKKKIGDILSHVTIGTNVTKGVSLIIQACLCPTLQWILMGI